MQAKLADVIVAAEDRAGYAKLQTIDRFTINLQRQDTIITFNYDTLIERSLGRRLGAPFAANYSFSQNTQGIPRLLKLHGSANWAVCDFGCKWRDWPRTLFPGKPGMLDLREHRNRDELGKTLSGPLRDLQWERMRWWPALAHLGPKKQVKQVPGLDHLWSRAEESLQQSGIWVFIGFSLSEFDAAAKTMFQRARTASSRQPIVVIDPSRDAIDRYRQTFGREIYAFPVKHEDFDWRQLDEIAQPPNRSTLELVRTGECMRRVYN
jgi:hypothetical protein